VILVDSSVWIDYFRGIQSSQTDRVHALLGNEPIATGDLVLAEVLQGFGSARDFNKGKKLLTSLPMIELVGGDIAVQAANNFRTLRSLGITVRKTIDTLIATSCIEKGLALL
jgi:predicted nucleic acid-binding protein